MLKSTRLDELADGIFAIVMTILVFEIKIPDALGEISNFELWKHLVNLIPSMLSYILSFALLFTYWRAHHFFISVYAKNIDTALMNINGFFFMIIALIPFSASVLGQHSNNELSIILFGSNIVIIGLTLYFMRRYVLYSPHIKNPEITHRELFGSTVRTMVPVIFALIAISLSFWNTTLSLALFTLAVIFNLLPQSTTLAEKFFHHEEE